MNKGDLIMFFMLISTLLALIWLTSVGHATTSICVSENGVNMGCTTLVPGATSSPTASPRASATPTPCPPGSA